MKRKLLKVGVQVCVGRIYRLHGTQGSSVALEAGVTGLKTAALCRQSNVDLQDDECARRYIVRTTRNCASPLIMRA